MLQKKLNINWSIVEAVIFDVDGTLYDQRKLRAWMFMELIQYYLMHPWRLQEWKILRDFRRERERHASDVAVNIESAQYNWGAQASGVSPEKVYKVVQKWIYDIPLRHIPHCRYQGILDFFHNLSYRGIATATFSDYPAREKLDALELSPDLSVCSTDKDVNALKPNPKGLFLITEILGVSIKHCLLIGDRDDRDGECSRRVGMPYLILERKNSGMENRFQIYPDLNRQLNGDV